MWVLEAWEWAEKVWYPIIWEKIKDADNIIDYNIQKEVTKDTSAEINANNQTTTGMATVIPWVNAPKLIAKTSIIWIDFDAWFQWGVQFRFYEATPNPSIPANSDKSIMVTRMTVERDERWPYDFKYINGKGIIMPSNWTYELTCIYSWAGSSWLSATFDAIVGWQIAHTSASMTGETTETFNINAYKWQSLIFRANFHNWTASAITAWYIVWVTIAKQ